MTLIEQLEHRTGLLTSTEMAAILGCHQKTLYTWIKGDKLPCLRVGARLKFDPVAVAEWLRKRQLTA